MSAEMRCKIPTVVQQVTTICSVVAVCLLLVNTLPVRKTEETAQLVWRDRSPRSLSSYEEEKNNINNYDVDKFSHDFPEVDYPLEKLSVVDSTTVSATVTAKPTTSLDDIFITVKTTKSFHQTRLQLILKTWFTMARQQTWFFTDTEDEELQKKTGGHLVNTNCSSSHNRRALCCKMASEFDAFLESNKRWWCHFDDDNYVNVPQLVALLTDYDPLQDWYLGKPSIRAPLEIINRDNMGEHVSFWFATGGAGFCISRSLATKMMPVAGGGKFISIGEKIRLPDDVTMGYIVEHMLRQKLTIIEEFHSHLEPMRFVHTDSLNSQISFGYSQYANEMNVLPIEGYKEKDDPTRMLSLHCRLFPYVSSCPR